MRRPDIEDRVEADIAILRSLAELTEQHFKNMGYSPQALVEEFDREIHREMDFIQEARATEHFRSIFLEDEAIIFPKIYWDATTSCVLTEEEIKGTLLSDPKAKKLPLKERRALVVNGTRAVLCQCLEAGYFHADPHPGNLFALSQGRIGFIDCGMIGQLDTESMNLLAELASGVVKGDADRVTKIIATLTDAPPEIANQRALRADIQGLISHFEHTSLGRLDIAALLQQFFEIFRAHQLRCPADLALLIKALTTIQSVGKELDPSFDFVGYTAPYIEKLISRHYSLSVIRTRVQKSLLEYAELAERLPGDVQRIVTQLGSNRVTINIEHRGLARITSTIEHASRNISFSMIIAAMLVGSSILVLSDREHSSANISTFGLIGFGAACVFLILRFIFRRSPRE